MQPIGDYLKKLLFQYNCIVVPSLGAFLTHMVSASFNEATGQFLPPRRKVAFNEALMLDDGILLNYVMLHEGITRDEALARITAFVATLKQQARQMGSFTIDGLGLFSYNAENRLQFDPELRHNFQGSTYGMQPILLANKVVHLAQPVATLRPLPVAGASSAELPAVAPVSALALVPAEEEEETLYALPVRRSATIWRWAAAAVVVGSLGFVSYFSVINPGEPLQSSLNPASLFRLPAFPATESAGKVAVAPVVKPAAVVSTPVQPQVEARVAPDPVPTVVATAPEVPVVASGAPNKPAVITKRVKPVRVAKLLAVKQARAQARFTVIAGSFASRRNAIRFQKRLVKAGYADAYILRGRGLIKVAAMGAQTLDEAQAGINDLNALTGITPFIMHN